jgi:hypothetical protein
MKTRQCQSGSLSDICLILSLIIVLTVYPPPPNLSPGSDLGPPWNDLGTQQFYLRRQEILGEEGEEVYIRNRILMVGIGGSIMG